MFRAIRYQLLFSYLLVLGSILAIFAISVRTLFERSLLDRLTEVLTTVAEAGTRELRFENGNPVVDSDFSVKDLDGRNQALQWFDTRGKLLVTHGKTVPNLAISKKHFVQTYSGRERIQSVTLPIFDKDKRAIGYVRASQSLKGIDRTLEQLNWGLGSGIAVALVLSGIGGIWLTRQSMRPIEHSFEQLEQFTADASHELRSPLAAIKNNSAVALKYADGMRPGDKQKFEAISNAANQIAQLTADLLLLARVDSTRLSNNLQSLNGILSDLVLQLQPQLEARAIELNQILPDDLYITGDTAQLSRLFRNLLENAIQYTPSGGRVTVRTTSYGQYTQVEIEDMGIGIAPEDTDKIFDRFWRADGARSYYSGGSGLGLAIARAIARHHKGEITFSSQLGKGTVFTVRFPTGRKYRISGKPSDCEIPS